MSDVDLRAPVGTRLIEHAGPVQAPTFFFEAKKLGFAHPPWNGGVVKGSVVSTGGQLGSLFAWGSAGGATFFAITEAAGLWIPWAGLAVASVLSVPALRDSVAQRKLKGGLYLLLDTFPVVAGHRLSATLISSVPLDKNIEPKAELEYALKCKVRAETTWRFPADKSISVDVERGSSVEHALGQFALPIAGPVFDPVELKDLAQELAQVGTGGENDDAKPSTPHCRATAALKLTLRFMGRKFRLKFPLPIVKPGEDLKWMKAPEVRTLTEQRMLSGGIPHCPRCEDVGLTASLGVEGGLGCPACKGTFLDASHAGDVLRRIGVSMSMARDLAQTVSSRGVRCPECRQEMKDLPLKGVRVDLCVGCGGMWVDKGELEDIERNLMG